MFLWSSIEALLLVKGARTGEEGSESVDFSQFQMYIRQTGEEVPVSDKCW